MALMRVYPLSLGHPLTLAISDGHNIIRADLEVFKIMVMTPSILAVECSMVALKACQMIASRL